MANKLPEDAFGLSSFIIGIISLVLLINNQMSSLILSILAIIFANKQNNISKSVLARWGKTTGIISLIISLVIIFALVIYVLKNPETFNQLSAITQ